nr:MAG TPA: hypothetical protein [Bacteriophage sp.]
MLTNMFPSTKTKAFVLIDVYKIWIYTDIHRLVFHQELSLKIMR